ncbi:hypothetical protein [Hymenobacter sp. CRA2]|uniref:hypothetical protein n=1 Tax=Hymenobacter sp. CRA2 TaxID=1955620 RepID=UPI00098F95B8|nr:hypothetical protein [Hymenobacter sp. CRA2]OON70230.1 hypothetical protein B0919_05705 [Hymenobacter sp. CRA2]
MLKSIVLAGFILITASTALRAQGGPVAQQSPADSAHAAAAPVPANIEAYVRSQTKGGELDFTKFLAPKKQTVFLHGGNMYSKRDYALVLWGMRVKALGLASAERACAVYTAATNHALTPAEKQALVSGFESGTRD